MGGEGRISRSQRLILVAMLANGVQMRKSPKVDQQWVRGYPKMISDAQRDSMVAKGLIRRNVEVKEWEKKGRWKITNKGIKVAEESLKLMRGLRSLLHIIAPKRS